MGARLFCRSCGDEISAVMRGVVLLRLCSTDRSRICVMGLFGLLYGKEFVNEFASGKQVAGIVVKILAFKSVRNKE